MIMRQMTQADYEYLMRYLRENAQADAFGVAYRLKLELGGARYFLQLRPNRHRRVYLTDVICAEQDAEGERCRWIADGRVCHTLLGLLLGYARLWNLTNQVG